jgi:hypothetical protein
MSNLNVCSAHSYLYPPGRFKWSRDSVNKSLLALRHSYELKEYNNYCKNKYLQKEAHKIVEFLIWPILVLTLLGNLAKDNVSFCHHLTSVVC